MLVRLVTKLSFCSDLLTWHNGGIELWDHWADLLNDDAWNWENVKEAYFRVRILSPTYQLNSSSRLPGRRCD